MVCGIEPSAVHQREREFAIGPAETKTKINVAQKSPHAFAVSNEDLGRQADKDNVAIDVILAARLSYSGTSRRHGPHHEAQRLITTTLP